MDLLQIPFYQQPPGVVPWAPATSPGAYYEAAAAASAANNFVHFVSTPPQQAFAGECVVEKRGVQGEIGKDARAGGGGGREGKGREEREGSDNFLIEYPIASQGHSLFYIHRLAYSIHYGNQTRHLKFIYAHCVTMCLVIVSLCLVSVLKPYFHVNGVSGPVRSVM